ncbi:hypothetical protein GBA52_012058 [Prunus armeniaca]|nr:hypothetical protein GBA52_012058 [Prunus armeniaca]
MSITSVLSLKDEVSIATAGAVDSYNDELSLDVHLDDMGWTAIAGDLVILGVRHIDDVLTASDPLHFRKDIYMEHYLEIAALDFSQLLALMLLTYSVVPEMEMPAFGTSHFEVGKMATSSDDFTVRIWNSQNSYCPRTNSPSVIQRRVMAIPGAECRKLLMNESMHSSKDSGNLCPSDDGLDESRFVKKNIGRQLARMSPGTTGLDCVSKRFSRFKPYGPKIQTTYLRRRITLRATAYSSSLKR